MVPEGKVPVDKVSPVPRDTGTLDIFTANTIRLCLRFSGLAGKGMKPHPRPHRPRLQPGSLLLYIKYLYAKGTFLREQPLQQTLLVLESLLLCRRQAPGRLV